MKFSHGIFPPLAILLVSASMASAQMIPIVFDDMTIMVPSPEVRPVAKRLLGQGALIGDAIASDFTTLVAMKVPSFRGIEPTVGLSYASSDANGFAGVGWSVTGLSQITRAGADRGAPRYDSSDVWMLDGMELIPCAVGSVAPSCTTGGTHSTRIETYVRIKRNGINNWTITATNGTKSNYTTAFNPTGNEYKTALTSVVDLHNNTATYLYAADGSNWLYPQEINFGRMKVKFYREARPDVVSLDAGAGKVLQMTQRLKLVEMLSADVSFNVSTNALLVTTRRARAYRIFYANSSSSNSVISSVQMYGTTATVDAQGNVSGTYLPPTSFSYSTGSDGSPKAELLKEVNNGTGGKTTVTYNASGSYPNTHLPVQLAVLQSISVSDGRNPASTTTFNHTDGKWDEVDQKFLGFLYTKIVQPCIAGESACPYTEIWNRQDIASAGKQERIEQRDGLGRIYSATQFIYTANTAAPFTSVLSQTVQEIHAGTSIDPACERSATCRKKTSSQTFDAYGNTLTSTYNNDSGARTDEFTYVQNPSLYLMNAKSMHLVYASARRSSTLEASKQKVPALNGQSQQSIPHTGAEIGKQLRSKGTMFAHVIPPQTTRLFEERYAYDQALTSAGDPAILPTKGDRTHVFTYSQDRVLFGTHKTEYDSFGNALKSTDADNNVVSTVKMDYESMYPEVVSKYATATTKLDNTLTWDGACQAKKSEIDPNGVVTATIFDEFCRPTRVDGALGAFVTAEYCAISSTTNQCGVMSGNNAQHVKNTSPSADGNGVQWSKSFVDGLGREYKSLSKGPSSTQDIATFKVFDARGNVVQTSDAAYGAATPKYVAVQFDAMNRPTKATNFDGKFVTTSYGLLSVTITDPVNKSRTNFMDLNGNVIEEQFTANGSVYKNLYLYDALDRKLRMTDAEGNIWDWTYDTTGDTTTVKDPDRGTWTYKYSADGEPLWSKSATNVTVTTSSDWLGRKTSKDIGTVNEAKWFFDEVRAGYFNKGRLTRMTDKSGSTTYDYDAAGQLVKMVKAINGAPSSFAFEYGYDAAGLLKWKKMPAGLNVGTTALPLTYDGAGRPKAIPGIVNDTTYLANGAVDLIYYTNGVVSDFNHDSANRLASIATKMGTTTLQNLVYTRDAEGKIKTITSPFAGEGWSYTYDEAAKRLLSASNTSNAADNQSFTYSPSGNMISNSRLGDYLYPAAGATAIRPHAPTQIGSTLYGYNANGSMTTRGASPTLTWNALEQLQSVGTAASFVYDGNGARVAKTSYGVSNSFYPSPDYKLVTVTSTANISHAGMIVARMEVGPNSPLQTLWMHPDHLGSTNVVSNASGVEVQRVKHRPYGERFGVVGVYWEKDFDFLGERRDDEIGLVYQRARYFDPVIGRYTAADWYSPVRSDVGPSRYAYAGNDPVNKIDNGNLSITIADNNLAAVFSQMNANKAAGIQTIVYGGGIMNNANSSNLTDNATTAANTFGAPSIIAVGNQGNFSMQNGIIGAIVGAIAGAGAAINAFVGNGPDDQVNNFAAISQYAADIGAPVTFVLHSNANSSFAEGAESGAINANGVAAIVSASPNANYEQMTIIGAAMGQRPYVIVSPGDPALNAAKLNGKAEDAVQYVNDYGHGKITDTNSHDVDKNLGAVFGKPGAKTGSSSPAAVPTYTHPNQGSAFSNFGGASTYGGSYGAPSSSNAASPFSGPSYSPGYTGGEEGE